MARAATAAAAADALHKKEGREGKREEGQALFIPHTFLAAATTTKRELTTTPTKTKMGLPRHFPLSILPKSSGDQRQPQFIQALA